MSRHAFLSTSRRQQAGVTLIELMVGITVGLLVVLAAVGSIVFTRASARTMTEAAMVEQQASLVTAFIGQQIKQAGALNLTVGAQGVSLQHPLDALGDSLVFVGGTEGGGPGVPDTLQISYIPPTDGSLALNCAGMGPAVVNGVNQIVSSFDIDGNNFRCGAPAAGGRQPIAENVLDFQVMYLRRTNQAGDLARENAAQIEAANNWRRVEAVEVCLHMAGLVKTGAPAYALVNCEGDSQTFSDSRIHRFIRQTYYLRNS